MFMLFVIPISSPCETLYLEMNSWFLSLLNVVMQILEEAIILLGTQLLLLEV